MRFFRLPVLLSLLLALGAPGLQAAAAPTTLAADRIVAVVNDEVITYRELTSRMGIAEGQLKRQGTPLPPRDVFEKQMLERMVIDRLQLQQAKETGLRIDDGQLDQALQRIASGNGMNVGQFRQALEKDGIPFAKFREDIREELTIARLREREVDNRIIISDGEVDNFLANNKTAGAANEELELAHILIRLPEGATPEQQGRLRAKAEQARTKLAAGEDFAQVAAAYSDAPDALQGGNIGRRTADRLPALYAEAARGLKAGEVSGVLRSANGFHLLKLVAKHGGAKAAAVQQTRVRHILLRVNELVSESEAQRKLADIRDRLVNGGDFAELARLYSQDGSAPKGGDLGWIYPGDTVPEFERAMDGLKPGELSQPVQSPFGWHLIQVQERRVQDVSDDRQRVLARQALRERKIDETYQDWLRQLRDRAYVELRLEER